MSGPPEIPLHEGDEAAELRPVAFKFGEGCVQTPGVGERSGDSRSSIRVLPQNHAGTARLWNVGRSMPPVVGDVILCDQGDRHHERTAAVVTTLDCNVGQGQEQRIFVRRGE
jgi:hypothetical protein